MKHKYISLKIKPLSNFISEPVSDSFFGQICYTLSLMGEDLDNMLKDYNDSPFLVVSDFLPEGYLSVVSGEPSISGELNIKTLANRKADKKRTYISVDDVIDKGVVEDKIVPYWKKQQEEHTYINVDRFMGKATGGGASIFNNIEYLYKNDKDEKDEFLFTIYMYVKDEFRSSVMKAVEKVGQLGYGGRASTGKGRYKVVCEEEIEIDTDNRNSLYTLGGCVISGMGSVAGRVYYNPSVRFGRHGVSEKVYYPFKKPYVMAESGALFYNVDNSLFNKAYIGRAVNGISFMEKTVSQGYSLYLPVNVEK